MSRRDAPATDRERAENRAWLRSRARNLQATFGSLNTELLKISELLHTVPKDDGEPRVNAKAAGESSGAGKQEVRKEHETVRELPRGRHIPGAATSEPPELVQWVVIGGASAPRDR